MIRRFLDWLNPPVNCENIIPVGTSRRFGKYIVRTVVELADQEEGSDLPYVTVAECGHCFEDVGERDV